MSIRATRGIGTILVSVSQQNLHLSYVLSEESSYIYIGMTVECHNQNKSNYTLRGNNYVHDV